ncbi:uncharacterized protein [Nicotiana tomentosiformis]|uniref:uncharacterized protein n=1 Tax=Nicotiana tomentosiformis TaxID=4098 RepID=UPI00388C9655
MVANKTNWILDTNASRHLCANKELFTTLRNLLMASVSSYKLSAFLNKAGLKLIFESDKIIISRGGDFVGNRSLFVLNIVQEITNNASTSSSAYIAESIDLCVAYIFMSLNDNSIYESRDEEFFEHVFPLKNNVPNNASTSMSVNSHIVPSSSVTANEHENERRRSKRHRIEASFGLDFITTFLTENLYLDILNDELVSIYLTEEDPKTYHEGINANFWKEGIKSELDYIVSNHTWDLSDFPKGCKSISSKWIFKKKLRPDGTIEK